MVHAPVAQRWRRVHRDRDVVDLEVTDIHDATTRPSGLDVLAAQEPEPVGQERLAGGDVDAGDVDVVEMHRELPRK